MRRRTKIYLLDGKSGERSAKFSSGHASAVTAMSFSADGRFLAAIAQGSRFVNVFDCKGACELSTPIKGRVRQNP